MINKILEMDKKAREMEKEAEEHKKHHQTEIEKRKQELYDQYAGSLKEIVEMTKAEQLELLESGKKELDEKTGVLLQVMEQQYSSHQAEWVKQITKEVVGND